VTTSSSARKGAVASAAAPSVSPNGVSLTELAARIRSEFEAAEQGHRDALGHAIRAGELLTQAKARMKHGEWLPWLEENFPGDRRTATRYMALAANGARVSHLGSVREALAAIRKPRQPAKPKKPKKPKKSKEEKLPPPEEAVERLEERVKRLRSHTRASMPKWSDKDMADVRAVLKQAKKKRRGRATGGPPSTESKIRENSALRKKLGRKSVADLQFRILQMTATLESSKIEDYDLADDDAYFVNELYDDLVELQFWMDHTLSVCRLYMDDAHELEVIRHLRENHSGMPPAEIETALAMADKLEAKRTRKLNAGG
jgi:Protein of unknown function (DUF3102)